MDFRKMSFDYFLMSTTDFCFKYRMGRAKAMRMFGKKRGFHKKDIIKDICIDTKLLPNEVIELLEEYTVTEIKNGKWRVENGYLKFYPKVGFDLTKKGTSQK